MSAGASFTPAQHNKVIGWPIDRIVKRISYRYSSGISPHLLFTTFISKTSTHPHQEYFPKELDPSTLSALSNLIQHLRSAGATVLPVSLPSTPYALSAYYVIASAEATSNLARYSGIHYGQFQYNTNVLTVY